MHAAASGALRLRQHAMPIADAILLAVAICGFAASTLVPLYLPPLQWRGPAVAIATVVAVSGS